MPDAKRLIATVRPLKQNITLSYRIPQELESAITVGTFVRVPIKTRHVIAIVTEVDQETYREKFQIRDISAVVKELSDMHYLPFLNTLSWYYQVKRELFFSHVWNFLTADKDKKTSTDFALKEIQRPITTLTKEQKEIVDSIVPNIITPRYAVCLIHGVTGSGKTECYKALIREVIASGKTALLLLPEVALAQAFEYRLKIEMPDILMHGFHSGNSKKERSAVFDALQIGKPVLIIGVHLPVMLPIAKLGLIIIDEEHDQGYQEKKHPKMNTKEIALFRAHQCNIPVVLGSATPSISTLYNIENKSWPSYKLGTRFSGAFPEIEEVSLLLKDNRSSFWISKKLEKEIRVRLEKKEQTLIFLNRRGMHFFVQCSACSFVFTCKGCAVSLTLHENDALICHYCARTTTLARQCPTCAKSDKNFIKKGVGTQQIVTILQSLFPEARIARFDKDVRKKRGATEDILDDMKQGNLDILVGTQAIARGLHFERVSLVGIVWADLHFNLPIYNAVEQGIQQLIQIAGRAGRSSQTSDNRVIVQTMTQHVALSYISEQKYIELYAQECAQRKQFLYPPYVRLSEIELRNKDEQILQTEAETMMNILQQQSINHAMDVHILGPVKPPISKIDTVYYMKIYLKSAHINNIIRLYQYVSRHPFSSKHFFVPNATTL